MFGLLFDLFNISFIVLIGWLILNYLSHPRVHIIKDYNQIALLFLISTVTLFIVYFTFIKQLFIIFSPIPFFLLGVFYCLLLLIYRFMRPYVDVALIEKLESKKVYFASLSYRYMIFKSFDILFQQVAILCVIAFLKDLHISYPFLVLFFAAGFSVSHFFMFQRGLAIGMIFLVSAFFGGLIFPLLLSLQYGIVYAFMLHWLFYIALGVFAHFSHKLHPGLKVAL